MIISFHWITLDYIISCKNAIQNMQTNCYLLFDACVQRLQRKYNHKKRKRNASAVGFKCNQCDSALSLLFANSFLRKHEQRNQRPERRQQRLGGGMPKSGSGASSPPPLAPQSAPPPPPPQSPFGPGGGHTHLPALLPVILLQVDFIHQQVNFAKTQSVLYEVQLQRTVAV